MGGEVVEVVEVVGLRNVGRRKVNVESVRPTGYEGWHILRTVYVAVLLSML